MTLSKDLAGLVERHKRIGCSEGQSQLAIIRERGTVRLEIANELSALLAQHAVAEPQFMEGQVLGKVLREHHLTDYKCSCGWDTNIMGTDRESGQRVRVLFDEDELFKRWFQHFRYKLALLAAPVAPPPPQADPWFKPYANCDWCGQATHDERLFGKSCLNGGG